MHVATGNSRQRCCAKGPRRVCWNGGCKGEDGRADIVSGVVSGAAALLVLHAEWELKAAALWRGTQVCGVWGGQTLQRRGQKQGHSLCFRAS